MPLESLEVRNCPHGRGVFALRDIGEGEEIRTFEGISFTTTPRSEPWKRWALIVGRTPDGGRLFWDEEPSNSPDYWSNFLDHSDKPNSRFVIDLKSRTARFVATKPIKAGEELFLNYKEYDPDNWTPKSSSVSASTA